MPSLTGDRAGGESGEDTRHEGDPKRPMLLTSSVFGIGRSHGIRGVPGLVPGHLEKGSRSSCGFARDGPFIPSAATHYSAHHRVNLLGECSPAVLIDRANSTLRLVAAHSIAIGVLSSVTIHSSSAVSVAPPRTANFLVDPTLLPLSPQMDGMQGPRSVRDH